MRCITCDVNLRLTSHYCACFRFIHLVLFGTDMLGVVWDTINHHLFLPPHKPSSMFSHKYPSPFFLTSIPIAYALSSFHHSSETNHENLPPLPPPFFLFFLLRDQGKKKRKEKSFLAKVALRFDKGTIEITIFSLKKGFLKA